MPITLTCPDWICPSKAEKDSRLQSHVHLSFFIFEMLVYWQAVSYLELFSGEANVFAAVKTKFTGTAVDIEYLQRVPPVRGARGNAFDLNSQSGLAWRGCRRK